MHWFPSQNSASKGCVVHFWCTAFCISWVHGNNFRSQTPTYLWWIEGQRWFGLGTLSLHAFSNLSTRDGWNPVPRKMQFIPTYLDDIVVFSRLPGDYIEHVRRVLWLLQDAETTKNLKSNFLISTIDYLDLVIRACCLEIATHTSDTIKKLKLPTNTTEICSFYWFCNVYCCLVPYFARVAAAINQKLKKDYSTHSGA